MRRPACASVLVTHGWIQRGRDRGSGPPPLKNHKYIGFPSITGPSPLKNQRLPSQHSMLGHHRYASEVPFKLRFAGGPIMARLWWYLDPLSPHQLKKRCQSDKTFWISAWYMRPRKKMYTGSEMRQAGSMFWVFNGCDWRNTFFS